MIATIGEALVDMIEQPDGRFQACLGGSVFNFTIGMGRQGIPTAYLNPLSEDRFGQLFGARLRDSGVLEASSTASACPTALAIVSIDAHGAPTYAFHREGVADRDISTESLIGCFPEQMELLHTGGLALVPEDSDTLCAALQAAAERGTLISIDANLRPRAVARHAEYIDAARLAMRHAHVIKVSDEDLVHLGLDAMSLQEVAATLFHESSVQLIAVTRGGQAAALVTRNAAVELPTPGHLKLVDTVGAGDCFQAGLIAYLYRQGALATAGGLQDLAPATLRCALHHAICAASVNVMRAGCDPATWDETMQFWTDWQGLDGAASAA